MKAKSVASGMVGMLRLLPFGRTYTGASGNQIDSDVPPDTLSSSGSGAGTRREKPWRLCNGFNKGQEK